MFKCYPHRVRCSSESFLYSLCAESFLTGMQLYRGNRELLRYFQELSSTYGGEPRGKFLLWNNKVIIILIKNHCFGKLDLSVEFIMSKTSCKTENFYLLTNSMKNLG